MGLPRECHSRARRVAVQSCPRLGSRPARNLDGTLDAFQCQCCIAAQFGTRALLDRNAYGGSIDRNAGSESRNSTAAICISWHRKEIGRREVPAPIVLPFDGSRTD